MASKQRVLVAGGAGFLGSHLCDRLVAAGHEVLCLDNYFTGDRRNIGHLLAHPRFEAIRHDVTQPVLLEVDWVFNLACPASPVDYQYNPIKTLKTSVMGSLNLLGLAKRVRARILQASTSEVYGDPEVHPQPEGYWGYVNPIGIRSCYDEGKRCAETLFSDYHRAHGTDIRIARIFNTYGPRMALEDGRVISNFALQALSGEPLTVYGEGRQTRSFCYVDDLVEGLLRLMAYEGNDCFEPCNLGNPGEYSMLELARIVQEVAGTDLAIIHQPLPEDDPAQRQPDIGRAKRNLDWEPATPLREGLARTVADFRERLAAGESRADYLGRRARQT
ncbi:MAG: SDR family oxidoreductase [Myxococcales bacterium]|nr:SDR family oxidoreductase [Myxococcales bacterium]